jgi:membrane fusion protein, multidrug efflux system
MIFSSMNSSPTTSAPPATSLPPPIAAAPPFRLRRIALAAVLLVIVAAIAGIVPRWRQRTALRVETAELSIPTVTVVSVAPGKQRAALVLPAEVRPFVEAPIYARANGYVKRWLVDLGAKVSTGQLLAEIDTPELNQELARARAEFAEAQATLALAKSTSERWAELVKTASVSQQEAIEKQSDLTRRTAALDAAQAAVKRLEEMQSFARVTAPFEGTITARRIDVGDLITAGSTRQLFSLAQTTSLRVYVRVPQSAARAVKEGQSAELTIPELPGRVFTAKIVRTAGAMSADSRTLLTELEVDNSKGEILSGSYAEIRFSETQTEAPMVLPSNVLLFRSEGTQVGLVQPDGKVELRNIRLGRDFGQTIEVIDGVTTNDQVIQNPADSLTSGTVVRLVAGQGGSSKLNLTSQKQTQTSRRVKP